MKVLHICTSDEGGAGLCCLRLHNALLNEGVDSKVVMNYKTRDYPEVYQYRPFSSWLCFLPSRILHKIGLEVTEYNRVWALGVKHHAFYSRPVSLIDLTKFELYDWADIIHLHWVNDFLDYPSFFRKTKKKIIWTLHDENLFYGIAHYGVNALYGNDIEKKYKKIKFESIRSSENLNVVFLSNMMYDLFGNNEIIRGRNKTIIHNSVDGNIFMPYDKTAMRRKYGISQNKTVFLFMSSDIGNPIKGLHLLVQSINELDLKNVEIMALGNNVSNVSYPIVRTFGNIKDMNVLSELISAVDYFAMPSRQEAFAQSPMEAMACGLPVVAFPVSGTKELINESNGIVCSDFTVAALSEGIKQLMSRTYNPTHIRNDVMNRFSPSVIAKQYIRYYQK
jgi:glycosyltransferase involved in cell wall biosynthesis